jgi:predicted nuclease with TOPRIM domain
LFLLLSVLFVKEKRFFLFITIREGCTLKTFNGWQEMLEAANKRTQVAEGLFQAQRNKTQSLVADLETAKLLLEESKQVEQALRQEAHKAQQMAASLQQECHSLRQDSARLNADLAAESLVPPLLRSPGSC